jgi:hypothetical protein
MADIIFTKTFEILDEYRPTPADRVIPKWYKELDSYIDGEKRPLANGQGTSATLKRCMPVFDAVVSGYIIPTYVDVFVSQKVEIDVETNKPTDKTYPYYEWPSFNPLGFHSIDQAPNYYQRRDLSSQAQYPKWISPWAIKTPPGYSCLFLPPVHRDSPFSILPGVVDTDTYRAPVNFPFVLQDWGFKGLIPAGVPMVQVIPFKRESWKMSFGQEEELQEQNKDGVSIRTKFFDSYKSQYRQTKEYK